MGEAKRRKQLEQVCDESKNNSFDIFKKGKGKYRDDFIFVLYKSIINRPDAERAEMLSKLIRNSKAGYATEFKNVTLSDSNGDLVDNLTIHLAFMDDIIEPDIIEIISEHKKHTQKGDGYVWDDGIDSMVGFPNISKLKAGSRKPVIAITMAAIQAIRMPDRNLLIKFHGGTIV